ncbi:hypothetical protein [Neoactinobaculum massilliense]|uniref:hypothetical protein n=1 Tax=Neoactinobaculum massilliense TaxID=2364794 RepID=UPI000F5213CC|nr:hypothetical protein [Neoactinobaculum massilliense]
MKIDIRLIHATVRTTVSYPSYWLTCLALIILWPGMAFFGQSSVAYDQWQQYYYDGSGFVGLFFPLFVTLLVQMPLLDEWSNTYFLPTRTRIGSWHYLRAKVFAVGLVAGATMALLVVLAFVLAKVTFKPVNPQGLLDPPDLSRYQFGQLWEKSALAYIVVFALWVGIVAASEAILAVVAAAIISNKLIAIAAPFLVLFVVNLIVQILGLEEFQLPPLRTNITQQPMWMELPGWFFIMLLGCLGLWQIRKSNYSTPGLVRS